MNTFFYIIIFIIGALFGSFYTLAVYRIPKKQDITHTHSYCPNCNHKLGFFELIPILSYIFLGGKCKHCKKKIRPRYFILEISSGIMFTLFAYAIGLNIENLNIANLGIYGFICLYLTFIFLIIGIDKENRKIEKSVLAYGIVISIMYIIYLYVVGKVNIYRYVIYLVLFLLWLILDSITLRKYAKNSYINGILCMLIVMMIFTQKIVCILSIITTILTVAIYLLFCKLKNATNRNKKTDGEYARNISIGFILGVTNIIYVIYLLLLNR